MKIQNYKAKIINGVRFSAYAMYRLDLQKWETENQGRIAKVKYDIQKNQYNKKFIIKIENYTLRAKPVFFKQTTLC